ncbi:MAG: radical SAM protein [Christensenellales bacterium]
MICELCPRNCKANRNDKLGFCGMSNRVLLAKADLFFWEEPVISGTNGSGAIFFSGCNLKCCFCQNYEISSGKKGKEITVDRLAQIFKELEQQGAHNINLVSPTHYVQQIIEALKIYRPKIPVVYNSNGYENVETIKKLKDYVDIYLVDLKFCDKELSQKYCKASNYFECATLAIKEMISQKQNVVIKNGIMQSGVIIRHLVMPNCTQDSKKILDWINQNAKDKALISLMSQYFPCHESYKHSEINRTITPLEYKIVLNYAIKLGLTNGFMQEFESATSKYVPIWDFKGV